MGPTWGRQDPGGLHVGPKNLAIWDTMHPRYMERGPWNIHSHDDDDVEDGDDDDNDDDDVWFWHNSDVIMGTMTSQITSLVYSTVYSGADQRRQQSPASLVFVRGIHRWPVNFPHKGPVTRKMFPFDDVIMIFAVRVMQGGCERVTTHRYRFSGMFCSRKIFILCACVSVCVGILQLLSWLPANKKNIWANVPVDITAQNPTKTPCAYFIWHTSKWRYLSVMASQFTNNSTVISTLC